MTRMVFYTRVSTGRQQLGLQAQLSMLKREALRLKVPMMFTGMNKLDEPGLFTDDGVSAFTTPFAKRPAGAKLLENLAPGDILAVAKLDRLCRSVEDFCRIVADLEKRSVRLVVCQPPLDLGTATGRMLARHLANIAEWESDRKGERIKSALKQKKLRTTPQSILRDGSETAVSLPSTYRPLPRPDDEGTPQIPGRVFMYTRVSHRDSASSGLGLMAQTEAIRNYTDALQERNNLLTDGDMFTDAAVSAATYDLRNRPAGSKLDLAMRRGDHIVFSSLDRAFRSVKDLVNTCPEWADRGIEVHFAYENLSMSDPVGKILASAIVQFAQMESELTSQRTREARAALATQGKYAGGLIPSFWNVYYLGRSKQMVLDRHRIVTYRYLHWLVHEKGISADKACKMLEAKLAAREGRRQIPQDGAYRGSIIEKSLSDRYPRDKYGRAFPFWTRFSYYHAAQHYQQAAEGWREVIRQRKIVRSVVEVRNARSPATEGMTQHEVRITHGELPNRGRRTKYFPRPAHKRKVMQCPTTKNSGEQMTETSTDNCQTSNSPCQEQPPILSYEI